MKKFEIYKNIRMRAMIFGLPVSLFALQMVSIVASLMVIIFSFSFSVILGVLIFNCSLYFALIRFVQKPQSIQLSRVFPSMITNKKVSMLDYEKD